ncbi:hypothetical protein GCM10009654_68510 [Streptomyces hebeiensis]|uniref:Uncharacterized protein n=1 Tax=Streptomyces hebeiensis TaxID=229486 RepID=A0ABN1VB01_9ACTN
MHDEFLCHVTAYGISGGQRIGVPLGTYRAPTLALALWWLRDRATWIAERLDPSPENPRFPADALTPVADGVPDVPTTLRNWRDDIAHQDTVAEHLAAGRLIRVATRDDTTEYELLAESVDALRMNRVSPLRPASTARQEPVRSEWHVAASALSTPHTPYAPYARIAHQEPAAAREHVGFPGEAAPSAESGDPLGDTVQFGRLYG